MPEVVEMRERKPRGQGRTRSQVHIPSADGVLRALIKSRDLEERQKLVDQSGESLDPTPTPSVQSLRLTHHPVVTDHLIDGNNNIENMIAREEGRVEVKLNEEKVLVTDHSHDVIVHRDDSSISDVTCTTSQGSGRRSASANARPAVTSNPQHKDSKSRDSTSQRPAERKSTSCHRSKSARREKRGGRREKASEYRVSCDTLTNEVDTPVGGSRDEVDRKKSNKKRFHKKRFAKKTGKKLLKGVRISCRFLWSGLALYARTFGTMEFNFVKAWEERQETERKRRQCYSYKEPKYYTEHWES